ncbi:MAG: hypothetical protein QOK29_4574 [Rhodospirillaceae bacterium]|jgi:NADH dehydrogenase|nr:hypothetical protein [Rhodospirillaceae bacterium]
MAQQVATVFGGSGFIGRYIVQRLAKRGWTLRIAVRRPDEALFLKPLGNVGQIVPIAANVRNERSIAAAIEGADTVINTVGILYERGPQRFDAVHTDGARRIARAAKAAGAGRLLHFSALGADPQSASSYARTKAAGEAMVREHFPNAVIFRPSIVFGPEDEFFNRFAAMARFSPFLPLIGGGRTRFQPVYVGDVADAAVNALESPDAAGRTFELAGPRIYSFKELMELLLATIRRKRPLLSIPFGLAAAQASVLQWLPHPPLTPDQLRLLKHDNVASGSLPGLADLSVEPSGLEAILPSYLETYRAGGRFTRAL